MKKPSRDAVVDAIWVVGSQAGGIIQIQVKGSTQLATTKLWPTCFVFLVSFFHLKGIFFYLLNAKIFSTSRCLSSSHSKNMHFHFKRKVGFVSSKGGKRCLIGSNVAMVCLLLIYMYLKKEKQHTFCDKCDAMMNDAVPCTNISHAFITCIDGDIYLGLFKFGRSS